MDLYKKFSNLFDVNIIKQLSNKDILISSSNQIKIYSINTFDKIYYFKEIQSSIISIKSISEINSPKNIGILLAFYLSDFSIQIIRLTRKIKIVTDSKKQSSVIYRHKLLQTLGIKINNKIGIKASVCINSCLNYLLIGISNKIQYFINKGEEKINFSKEKEYKINPQIKSDKYNNEYIKGISSINYKKYNLLIIIEEIKTINQYDIKIYYFEKFELITHFRNIYIFPEKGLMSYMTCPNDKLLYLVLGDKNDGIMVVKLFDDFDIYENINLSKIIKELSYNQNNNSNYYEIKSICGLNDGTFVICLYYNKPLDEKNYLIRGRINPKTKKFELLYINDNVHNNKSNFITSSSMIINNKKPEETYFISGDHEGMLKIWKMNKKFKK